MLNYVSKECYTSGHKETRVMCIRKKTLLEMLDTYPLINDFYVERAKKRRVEFRRIKAIYLEEHAMDSESEEEDTKMKTRSSVEI